MPARIAPVRVSTPASVPSASVSTATSTGACSSRSNTFRGSVPTGALTKSDTAMSRTRVNRSTPTQPASVTRPIGPSLEDDHGGAVGALVDQRHRIGHRIVGGEHHRGVHHQVTALDEVDRLPAPPRSEDPAAERQCRRGARPSRPSAGPPPRSCWPPPPGSWCPSRRDVDRSTSNRDSTSERPGTMKTSS